MKRLFLAAVASITMAGSFAAPAFAQKITIMVGGMDKQIYLPAKLAEEIGAFKEQGLDVAMLDEPAGVEAETAMLAGEVQGVVGFYDHCIDLQAHKKYALSVVQFSRAPGEVELVSVRIADKVKTMADFKGHSLGVTGLGSSTNFLTLALAARAGLKPGDVTPVAVGAGNTFLAAMQKGTIDGGMTTEPTISRALSTDLAKILIDMRTVEGTRAVLGGTYPAASLYMTESWVNAHPTETQKLANAFVKTMHFIDTHNAEEITALMPKDYYAADRAAYVKALAAGKAMFTADGKMPTDGPATVLKVLADYKKEIASADIDLARTFTTKYVDAAAKSGM